MRLLDTHEQKSPRFLMDAFPDMKIAPLKVGDYFSGERRHEYYNTDVNNPENFDEDDVLYGNLVEIKIGKDFGIHTEQLERFQDECYRMACYRQKNPHVQLHAVWVSRIPSLPGIKLFFEICFKYHIWGHHYRTNEELIQYLKHLDQPASYKEFEPYIKRSHTEPSTRGKMLRQIDGVNSANAIQSSEAESFNELADIFQRKKNGEPRKIVGKIMVECQRFTKWFNRIYTTFLSEDEES